MKYKTTMRDVKASYNTIIKVGYCDLQGLLNYEIPVAYTCGVYGWNADIYEIDSNTCIVTGYRPFGKSVNYDTVKKYNELGYNARKECNYVYEDTVNALNKLIADFVAEVKNEF